jgi:HD superfamily phosphohydrolase
MAAGLLHDVGHGPFSHTLEHILSSKLSIDHMHLTQAIILGEDDNVHAEERKAFPDVPRIPAVLEKHDVPPKQVAALIRGPEPTSGLRSPRLRSKRYLGQIIHSAIDADQIDYLMRDAHYTGAAHGMIDFHRIVQTVTLHNDELAVDRKGLPALEGMLVARALMYSSVYFHKTVRIAEQMVTRAVERSSSPDMRAVQKMVDAELLQWLVNEGGFQREIAIRIKYRKLYKRVWDRGREELTEQQRAALLALAEPSKRRRAEDAVCQRAGLPEDRAIIDIPLPELLISEPRIAMTDVRVLDGDKVHYLRKLSPLGRALQARQVSDWVVMVAADPKFRKEIGKAAEHMLFA